MTIIDAHSHLWWQQDTTWNGLPIRTLEGNGSRSNFLGEERQMLPPFMTDGHNTAEVFLSNMDYAQVAAAVVVQEFIDGLQNTYLSTVADQHPDRFFCYAMADYRHDGFYEQAQHLMAVEGFRGMAIPAHRLLGRSLLGDEMMRMFRLMEAHDWYLSITLADGDEQVSQLSEVIRQCPRLRIAIGHLAMAAPPATPPWENPSWQRQVLLARNKNVMLECGGITWLYNSEFYPFPSAARALREAADLVGADKLMWGSDYPRTITAITYRMSYDFICRSPLFSDAELAAMLGENALRFYPFRDLPELPYIKNMSE